MKMHSLNKPTDSNSYLKKNKNNYKPKTCQNC